MFFKNKITSIKPHHKVLEIGPGALPHPRSDVFLDKLFSSEQEQQAQSGGEKPERLKNTVYYDGGKFPFKDKEFDYVICSHVMEHVEDVDEFAGEIMRVGNAGYIEFPTIYYEFLYDFNVHLSILKIKDNRVFWMPKKDLNFQDFSEVRKVYRELAKNDSFKHIVNTFTSRLMFDGMEWENSFEVVRATDEKEICFDFEELEFPMYEDPNELRIKRLLERNEELESSWTFRIGNYILTPLRLLRKPFIVGKKLD